MNNFTDIVKKITILIPQMNPLDLINSEVVIGGRKDSLVEAQGQKYRLATYPADLDSTSHPSLFLPDQDGHLTKGEVVGGGV